MFVGVLVLHLIYSLTEPTHVLLPLLIIYIIQMLTLKRTTTRAPCRGLLAAPPRDPVRLVWYAGQTGFAGKPDEDPTNARPGGTPSWQAHHGLP